MKRLPTTITILVTIVTFTSVISPGYGSDKPELEKKVDAFLKVNDYDRAFKMVDDFLQQQPDVPIGYAMLERVITAGCASLKADDRKLALKLIDGYIQQHPEKPIGRAMMARVLAADGKTEDAFLEYARFYKLSETISPDLLMEIVRRAISHSEKDVRTLAAVTAEMLDDKSAVPALINVFNEMRRSSTRWDGLQIISVTSALGALGDKRATPVLIKGFELYKSDDEKDVHVWGPAARALGKLGDESAVPYLIEALNNGYVEDPRAIVIALGELRDKRARRALHKVLITSSEGYARVRAALALARVGGEFYKEQGVTALIDVLNDASEAGQQRAAAAALAELGDERSVSTVLRALKNNIAVSEGCNAQIRLGEKGDRRAVPYLIDILNNGYNNTVRWRVAKVLGELGDKRAIPALINALSYDGGSTSSNKYLNKVHMLMSVPVQLRAAETLAKLGDGRGVPRLMSAINDGSDDERGNAAVALAELGEESIAAKLIEILGGNESIDLKFLAAEALVKLSR